jgi:hypothetical protein
MCKSELKTKEYDIKLLIIAAYLILKKQGHYLLMANALIQINWRQPSSAGATPITGVIPSRGETPEREVVLRPLAGVSLTIFRPRRFRGRIYFDAVEGGVEVGSAVRVFGPPTPTIMLKPVRAYALTNTPGPYRAPEKFVQEHGELLHEFRKLRFDRDIAVECDSVQQDREATFYTLVKDDEGLLSAVLRRTAGWPAGRPMKESLADLRQRLRLGVRFRGDCPLIGLPVGWVNPSHWGPVLLAARPGHLICGEAGRLLRTGYWDLTQYPQKLTHYFKEE